MVKILYRNRYLLRELIFRDIRVRYIGSIVGLFWSVLNPLLQLALYTVVFSVVLEVRFSERATTGQFAEVLFCALLPWMAFQEATTRSSTSFLENSNLIKKLRFPLEVIPLSIVGSAVIHQLIGTAVFSLILVYTGSLYLPGLFLFPLLLIFQIIMMSGMALAVSSVNVFFRDVVQVLGVLFMLLFWMTPIVYPKSRAPSLFQWILDLNPLTHMVDAYRFVFLGYPDLFFEGVVYWLLFSLLLGLIGAVILNRTRKELVDLV